MRLNVWQRAALVASVLWAIGSGVVLRLHDKQVAALEFERVRSACLDRALAHLDLLGLCASAGRQAQDAALSASGQTTVLIALTPLLCLALAYLATLTVRWVLDGREPPIAPQ